MNPYDDSIVDEDIDPDVLRTLDELDLLDTLGMDSEDIGALTNPSSNDTEGWIQKMKKPKNKKKKPKRKRIPTALLSLPIQTRLSSSSNDGSSTASAPPSVFARKDVLAYLDALTERVHNKPYRALEQTISVLPSVATVPTPSTTTSSLLRTDMYVPGKHLRSSEVPSWIEAPMVAFSATTRVPMYTCAKLMLLVSITMNSTPSSSSTLPPDYHAQRTRDWYLPTVCHHGHNCYSFLRTIEAYKNKVDDRSMKVGGKQCIRTNDGYVIPLDYQPYPISNNSQ
jgi:hypothetical protein